MVPAPWHRYRRVPQNKLKLGMWLRQDKCWIPYSQKLTKEFRSYQFLFGRNIFRVLVRPHVRGTQQGSWSVNCWKMTAKHIGGAVFRVVLSAWRCVPPLSLRSPTQWGFQLPLSGPPSSPKPSHSLLFLCVVLWGLLLSAVQAPTLLFINKYLPLRLSLLPKKHWTRKVTLNRSRRPINHVRLPPPLAALDARRSSPAICPVYWPF